MRPWDHILRRLRQGFKKRKFSRSFDLDTVLQTRLVDLARQQDRSAEEVEADLLEAGLDLFERQGELQRRWQSLSAREQQVAALTCLGYTNPQIGARLVISVETVKTHMRNILVKYNLHGKAQLKKVLERWDFNDWEKYIPSPKPGRK